MTKAAPPLEILLGESGCYTLGSEVADLIDATTAAAAPTSPFSSFFIFFTDLPTIVNGGRIAASSNDNGSEIFLNGVIGGI